MQQSEKSGINAFMASIDKSKTGCDLDKVPVRGGSKASTLKAPSSAAKRLDSAKKAPFSKFSQDQTDKIFDLERENTSLKSKENLLETEIVKMKTKLRRIDELMKKKRAT
jgi:hypothetical protein